MPTTKVNPRAAEILERKWANPFRPFVIKTDDGRNFLINDLMHVTVLPLSTRKTVHLSTSAGSYSMPVTAIKSVELAQTRRRTSRRRSK